MPDSSGNCRERAKVSDSCISGGGEMSGGSVGDDIGSGKGSSSSHERYKVSP
jgi:hypothetical protein